MNRRDMLRSSLAFVGASMWSGSLPLGAVPFGYTGDRSSFKPEPFRVNFGQDRIAELYRRIDAMLWPELPFETGWSVGTNDRVLRDLVRYWREKYDWFRIQDELNQLSHFTMPVEGERMHFVRYGDSGKRHELPILLLHGWPSSFLEFADAAPRLASVAHGEPGFDLVVPSLPGFVFSDAPRAPGMHPGRIAERMHLLMRQLGHERYGVQGGDWGAVVATELARRHPEAVAGLHLNAAPASPKPEGQAPTEEEKRYVAFREGFNATETAYFNLQATKPQTLAYSLQDSPVGLLAWILEKYWSWTDHGEDLWETLDRDTVLTTVMLYWLPGRVLSASRIYHEALNVPPGERTSGKVLVPTGYAKFPKEPWSPPRTLVEPGYNLVHYSEQPRGGHFAAMEQPELWARDVAAFFSAL